MLSFLPYTFDCCVRLFSGFFHKHKLCQNMKFSINCAVYCASDPSPKHRITLVLNPVKCIRKSEFTCFKLAHTLDGLGPRYIGIAYEIPLLCDTTQPRCTSEEDDSHACARNKKGIAVRGICLPLLGTHTIYKQISGVLKCFLPRKGQDIPGKGTSQPDSVKTLLALFAQHSKSTLATLFKKKK